MIEFGYCDYISGPDCQRVTLPMSYETQIAAILGGTSKNLIDNMGFTALPSGKTVIAIDWADASKTDGSYWITIGY